MSTPDKREELEAIVRAEAASVGIVPETLTVAADELMPWWVELEVKGRRFSFGVASRDGFGCYESTGGKDIDFTAHVDPPIVGHPDRLRIQALHLIRHALDHPDFRGFVRPVI